MYETSRFGIHWNLSAVLAAAIVGVSGLIFDRAHLASAPEGSIEVGQLETVGVPGAIAALPELVVTAKRA